MTYVADTHALVRVAESSPRLSPRAHDALTDPSAQVVVPPMVLAEIQHLYARKRIATDAAAALERFSQATGVGVYPLDRMVADRTRGELDIHDAIIVSTALPLAHLLGEPVAVVTQDADITGSGLVETIW